MAYVDNNATGVIVTHPRLSWRAIIAGWLVATAVAGLLYVAGMALGFAAFDASDSDALRRFFRDLPAPIDHVMVTGPGPAYGPLLEMDSAQVRAVLSDHVVLALEVARNAAGKMRPGGTLLFMGGTGGRRVGHGLGIASAATAALPPFVAALALELAPVRVNLIAAGFVDTPLSASLLGDRLDERRNELRATLPIDRRAEPVTRAPSMTGCRPAFTPWTGITARVSRPAGALMSGNGRNSASLGATLGACSKSRRPSCLVRLCRKGMVACRPSSLAGRRWRRRFTPRQPAELLLAHEGGGNRGPDGSNDPPGSFPAPC